MHRLEQYRIHSQSRCAKDSRICRYCHPEEGLVLQDNIASLLQGSYTPDLKKRQIDAEIIQLLCVEERYRNKLDHKGLTQLEGCIDRGTLRKLIRSRIVKRLKTRPDKDGIQTPYMAHGIDTTCHTCAICCRGCLQRWHKIPRNRELSEREIDRLTYFIERYIRKFLGSKSIKHWMTVSDREDFETERFYEPGEPVIERKRNRYVLIRVSSKYLRNTGKNFKKLRVEYRRENRDMFKTFINKAVTKIKLCMVSSAIHT